MGRGGGSRRGGGEREGGGVETEPELTDADEGEVEAVGARIRGGEAFGVG